MHKKGFKVFIPILVTFALLSTMVGCGNADNSASESKAPVTDTTATQSEATATNTSAESAYDFSEPLKMVFYWNYSWKTVNKKFEETIIGKEIQKRTNTTIEIQSPSGNENEKLNLMIASDTLPDVIMMDRNEAYKKLIDLGKLVELDPYYEKYPGYRTESDPSTVNFSKVNGKIYSILNWSTTPEHATGNGGWMVNDKIYKELGSPAINTFDDLYSYLKQIKTKDYKVNGKNVIPMQFDAGNFQAGLYQLYYSLGGIGTISNEDMCYVDGDKLKFFMTDPRWEQSMVFANKLWNDGLMNSDYFVETSQQMNDKRDTGRMGVYTSSNVTGDGGDGRLNWQKIDPAGEYQIIEPPAGGGYDQKKIANATYKTLGWNSICITKNAKNPERIFQTIDWIASDEGQLITFYGPKGYLYNELDENGYPIMIKQRSDLSKEEADTLDCEEFSTPGMAVWCDLSKVAANERSATKDYGCSYQTKITWKHSANVTEFENIFTDASTPEGVAFKSVQDMVRRQIPKMVMAKSEAECKKVLQETIDQAYKLKFDTVETYKTKLWQENLKKLK